MFAREACTATLRSKDPETMATIEKLCDKYTDSNLMLTTNNGQTNSGLGLPEGTTRCIKAREADLEEGPN